MASKPNKAEFEVKYFSWRSQASKISVMLSDCSDVGIVYGSNKE